jgi:hypothetical protein
MLELMPTCENCNKALPPESLEARICSHECTFCASCVEGIGRDILERCTLIYSGPLGQISLCI